LFVVVYRIYDTSLIVSVNAVKSTCISSPDRRAAMTAAPTALPLVSDTRRNPASPAAWASCPVRSSVKPAWNRSKLLNTDPTHTI